MSGTNVERRVGRQRLEVNDHAPWVAEFTRDLLSTGYDPDSTTLRRRRPTPRTLAGARRGRGRRHRRDHHWSVRSASLPLLWPASCNARLRQEPHGRAPRCRASRQARDREAAVDKHGPRARSARGRVPGLASPPPRREREDDRAARPHGHEAASCARQKAASLERQTAQRGHRRRDGEGLAEHR